MIPPSQPRGGISAADDVALCSLRASEGDRRAWPHQRLRYLQRLGASGISIEMLQFAGFGLRFVVAESAVAAVSTSADACGLIAEIAARCRRFSIVGTGIAATAAVFGRTLAGLADRNVPVLHVAGSSAAIALVVPAACGAVAEAYLREAFATSGSVLGLDGEGERVRVNGTTRRLGARQAKLLAFFVANAGRTIQAEEAARHLFGSDGKDELAALRVHLHNLRKKIETDPEHPRHIVTVPAQGYRFVQ